jgi:hypothetical protein
MSASPSFKTYFLEQLADPKRGTPGYRSRDGLCPGMGFSLPPPVLARMISSVL